MLRVQLDLLDAQGVAGGGHVYVLLVVLAVVEMVAMAVAMAV